MYKIYLRILFLVLICGNMTSLARNIDDGAQRTTIIVNEELSGVRSSLPNHSSKVYKQKNNKED